MTVGVAEAAGRSHELLQREPDQAAAQIHLEAGLAQRDGCGSGQGGDEEDRHAAAEFFNIGGR